MSWLSKVNKLFLATLATLSLLSLVNGDCNPLTSNTTCAPILGFQSDYSVDFTSVSSIPADWIIANYENVTLGPNGAEFTFAKRHDAPYMWTAKYMFFGHVEVVMKCAKGTGMISSAVLLSDDLDEIDYEFSGNNFAKDRGTAQTNYFGKGVTGDSSRGTYPAVADPTADFHTWTFDWSPSQLSWGVDGLNLRTLYAKDGQNFSGAWFQYPQTPARLHLGLWDAGDPDVAGGTVFWAGGYTNLSQAPFTMYVKSVKIQPMFPGYAYNYTNLQSNWPGQWTDIKLVNTTANPTATLMGTSNSNTASTTIRPILNSSGVTGTTASGTSNISSSSSGLNLSASFSPTSASASPTYVLKTTVTPSPVQPSMIPNCNAFYKVAAGDDCGTVAQKCGISVSDFKSWNPDVGPNCWNLWLNYYQCVGVSDGSMSTPTSALGIPSNTSAPSSTTSSASNLGSSSILPSLMSSPLTTALPVDGSSTTRVPDTSTASIQPSPILSDSNVSESIQSPTSDSSLTAVATVLSISTSASSLTESVQLVSVDSIVPSSSSIKTSATSIDTGNSTNTSFNTQRPPITSTTTTSAVSSTGIKVGSSATVTSPTALSLGADNSFASTLGSLTGSISSNIGSLSGSLTSGVSTSAASATESASVPSASSANALLGLNTPSTSTWRTNSSAFSDSSSGVNSFTSVDTSATSALVTGVRPIVSATASEEEQITSPITGASSQAYSSTSGLSSLTISVKVSLTATNSQTTRSSSSTLKMSTSVRPTSSYSASLLAQSSPTRPAPTSVRSGITPELIGTPKTSSTATPNPNSTEKSSTPAPSNFPVASNAWLDWLRSVAPGLKWRLCSNKISWSFLRC